MRPLFRCTLLAALAVATVRCGTSASRSRGEPREAELKMKDAKTLNEDALAAAAPDTRVVSALAARAPNVAIPVQSSDPSFLAGQAETLTPSMIIRTGAASVEVDSLAVGVARVRDLARRVGGFVGNLSMESGRQQPRAATLEVRLPSSRFDEAIAGLEPIGRLESVNTSAQDVGEEYVDIAARVANSHRLEQRLIDVLANRTGKLRDVLDVERELARVREEIERMEGRLRYLRSRVATSTLSITVHEPRPVVGQRGSGNVIGDAFKQSWRNFIHFVAGFIAALGTWIPTLLVLVALALGLRALWRRYGPPPTVKPKAAEKTD